MNDLVNTYAEKAGKLAGILEILPLITKGLSPEDVQQTIEKMADRAREIMAK